MAKDDLSIQILTEFESVQDMNNKLQRKLQELQKLSKIKLDLDFDNKQTDGINKIQDSIKEVTNQLKNTNPVIGNMGNAIDTVVNKFSIIRDETKDSIKYTTEYINKNKELIKVLQDENNNVLKTTTTKDYKAERKEMDSFLKYIASQTEKLKNIQSSYNIKGIDKEGNNFKILEQGYNNIISQIEKYKNKNESLSVEEKNNLESKINNLKRLSSFYKENERVAENKYKVEQKELEKLITLEEKYQNVAKKLYNNDIIPKGKIINYENMINKNIGTDFKSSNFKIIEDETSKLIQLEKELQIEKKNTLKDTEQAFKEQGSSLKYIASQTEKLKNIQASYNSKSGVNKEGQNFKNLEQEYSNIINLLEEYKSKNQSIVTEDKINIESKISNLKRLSNHYKDLEKTAEKGFNFKQYKDVTNEMVKFKSSNDAYNKSLLLGHKLISANVQETEEYVKVSQSLQQGNYLKNIGVYIDKATGKMYEFNKSIRNNMVETLTWSKALKTAFTRTVQWMTSTSLVFAGIGTVKNGLTTIKNIDDAMVDLKKVTDETANTYARFRQEANELAKSVGHTTEATINSTTEFAKLGYTLEESKKLAKEALIYSNIGDIDIKDATKSITSTLAGFRLEVESTRHVIDSMNEVGNKFSVSTGGVGIALQKSSSALKEANNSLEESIGLIVAGNKSIQDEGKVGNALKLGA